VLLELEPDGLVLDELEPLLPESELLELLVPVPPLAPPFALELSVELPDEPCPSVLGFAELLTLMCSWTVTLGG
jgi:hypothetical protein